MSTRTGKIARLPRPLRELLNRRLDDNAEPAKNLLDWLNGLDDVKQVLARHFEGRPINEQNITEWKQGGFLAWQRRQDIFDRANHLLEAADGLADPLEGDGIPDRLARVLAMELAAETQRLLDETTDPKVRWQYLRQALRQVNMLRRSDYRAARAEMDRVRWEVECEDRDWEENRKTLEEARDQAMAPIREAQMRPALVEAYGGGEAGEKAADFIINLNRHATMPRYVDLNAGKPVPRPRNQAKSNQIKPNQAKTRGPQTPAPGETPPP